MTAAPARPAGAGAEDAIEPWRMAFLEDLAKRETPVWVMEFAAAEATENHAFARGYAAGAAAERGRARTVREAAERVLLHAGEDAEADDVACILCGPGHAEDCPIVALRAALAGEAGS